MNETGREASDRGRSTRPVPSFRQLEDVLDDSPRQVPPKNSAASHRPRRALVRSPYLNGCAQILGFPNLTVIQPARCSQKKSPRPRPRRGIVSDLSRKSQQRAKRYLSSLSDWGSRRADFLSLTYHLDRPGLALATKGHRMRFQAFLRRRVPGHGGLWRIEPQKRGVPHYHMVLFYPANTTESQRLALRQLVLDEWHRIADAFSPAHEAYGSHARPVSSPKQARSYITKYCSKEDTIEGWSYQGRRWALFGKLTKTPRLGAVLDPRLHLTLTRIFRKWAKSVAGDGRTWYRSIREGRRLELYIDAAVTRRVLCWLGAEFDSWQVGYQTYLAYPAQPRTPGPTGRNGPP